MIHHAENLDTEDVGNRLIILRKKFRFSRKYFHENYGLPAITLQKWENSERKVNENAIEKILQIYKNENIQVTKEWILKGSGSEPHYIFESDLVENFSGIDFSDNDELNTNREIKFFERNQKNTKVIIIEDEDMMPMYQVGDYVGGVGIAESQYKKIENTDCIVSIKKKSGYLLRRVSHEGKNKFRLSITNTHSKNEKPVIYNASPAFIAPVIWIRRPNRFK